MKKILILLVLVTSVFANIGTVMALKGEAKVERLSGDVSVKSGMKLLEGDTIVTQAKSRVQVMLKDETVVTIGSKSTFSFDEYSFDGVNSKVAMKSSRGFFRSVTGKIGKLAPQRFKVKTASATIGIRGTDFWGITGGETERVTCNKGAIVIEFDGKVIEVGAGQYASYGARGVEQGESSDDGGDDSGEEGSDESDEEDEGEESEGSEGDTTLEDAIEADDIEVNVPTEDISDISPNQIVPADVHPVVPVEPFTIDIGGEDRPVQY